MEFIAEAVELTRNATCPGDFDRVWELVTKATEDPETASGLGFTMARSLDPVEREIGFDLLGSLAQVEESLREPVLFACLELVAE